MTRPPIRRCACGCGFGVTAATLQYMPGHHPDADPAAPVCRCGCGKKTRRDRWQYHFGYTVPPKPRPAAKPKPDPPEIPKWFADAVNNGQMGQCWVWPNRVDAKGYGVTYWGRRNWRVHRLAWKLSRGLLSSEDWVLHRCDNPPCFNPDHLFLGDHDINMADMADKDRSTYGESHAHVKLTEDQVHEILRRAIRPSHKGARDGNYRQLAAEFGVHRVQISRICRGLNWRRVQPDVAARR